MSTRGFSRPRAASLVTLALSWAFAASAQAMPSHVSVTPPDGARFLPGQRFDVRVEGAGVGPYAAELRIDGKVVEFTSGAQNTSHTDGITVPGFGGFNVRGFSLRTPGRHEILATFRDAEGQVQVRTHFEIVRLNGAAARARNVILLVGDGMGVAHRTAARLVRHGVRAGDPLGYLEMERFPVTGLVTTHSLDSIVTDSAPGMSSYTTGAHAKNGQAGVFPAHVTSPFYQPRVEYMAAYLHRTQGKALGVVTTADVTDATPTAAAVHTGNRNAGTGIADQFLDESGALAGRRVGSGLRVLLGGGRRYFLPAGTFGSSRSASTDYGPLPRDLVSAFAIPEAGAIDPERDLIVDFTRAGFTYVDSASSLSALSAAEARGPLLGLFAYGNLNTALDRIAKRRGQLLTGARTFAVDDFRAPDQPMLDEMTRAALRALQHSPGGFVLIVEGALIDKQSHAMDASRAIADTIELDRAVAVAREFAERVDRRTLVLVTADHETAGLSLIGGLRGSIEELRTLPPDGTAHHPDILPSRQAKVGVYEDAAFPRYVILEDGYPETFDIDGRMLFGFGANGDRHETWLTPPRPIVDSLLPEDLRAELLAAGYPSEPFVRAAREGFFVRGQAVARAQATHTAADVPIAAYAARRAWAAGFGRVQSNVDVFFEIMRALLGGR